MFFFPSHDDFQIIVKQRLIQTLSRDALSSIFNPSPKVHSFGEKSFVWAYCGVSSDIVPSVKSRILSILLMGILSSSLSSLFVGPLSRFSSKECFTCQIRPNRLWILTGNQMSREWYTMVLKLLVESTKTRKYWI